VVLNQQTVRGCWYDIVHAQTEDICDDTKDSISEELKCVLGQFYKYYMKILLEHFSTKISSNLQLGLVIYMKLVMIMLLE
jgi:hypothetical protein